MENALMASAIALAIDNVQSGRGGPFAAIVVQKGVVVASGVNGVTATNDPTAHAEIVAIRAACKTLNSFQLTGCEIYTTCEPCPMCLGAIYWARPDRVFFGATARDAAAAGFDDAFIYEQLQLPHPSRKIPFLPLMRDQALDCFREWEAKTDRVDY